MRRANVVVLTESPDDCQRTWPTIKHIIEPLEDLGAQVYRKSVLKTDPKNGKHATKTELKSATDVITELESYKYVVLVGNTPLQLITGSAGISKARGKPFKRGNTIYLPMNNPSILHHDPNQAAVLENDLKLMDSIIQFGGIPEEKKLSIRIVTGEDDFEEMLKDLRGSVSFDIETNSLNAFQDRVLGKNGEFIPEPAKITMIGFSTARHQWMLGFNQKDAPLTFEQVAGWMDRLTEVLDDCLIITHNGKFDMLWMWQHFGVKWEMHFDTMLAHYLLDENSRHGLKYLAQVFLNAPDWEVDLDTKKGAGSFLKQVKYAAHDVYYTRQLKFVFSKMLAKDQDVKGVFDLILMPSANLFVEIEYDGVFIDISKFEDAEQYLREQYDGALVKLKQWEPRGLKDARGRSKAFNWGSPKQLGELLFDRLKLPVIERTAAGGRSCSESVLKRLNHPMVTDLLSFREAKQQLSFFIDGWRPYLHERPDGFYLHPSFKLHGTVTGRLSCENPNLQQVPRDPRIRTLISAPEGWTLIECDLSQVELRVAAELSGDAAMIHAFVNGIDIHWLTAISEIERGGGMKDLVLDTARTWKQDKTPNYSQSIKVLLEMGPDEAVEIRKEWKELRKKAKAVNFGYLYGMWWKRFKDYARDSYGVILEDEEAEASRNAFFDNYKDLPNWHNRQRKFVRRHGYVPSLTGRKRRLPDAMLDPSRSPEHKMKKQQAERQSINSPVQSYANDHNLMSALQLRKEYSRKYVRMCGTVHDAILLRVKNEKVEEVYTRLLEIMSSPSLLDDFGIELSVPIEADGSIGPWGAGVSLKKWREANGLE